MPPAAPPGPARAGQGSRDREGVSPSCRWLYESRSWRGPLGFETALGDLHSLRGLRVLEISLSCAQLGAQNEGWEQKVSWPPSPILYGISSPSSVSRITARPRGVSCARKSHYYADSLPPPAKSSLLPLGHYPSGVISSPLT